jgi:NADH:ubiquinone oxidoreductase subunit 6 (subunit J)
MNELTVIGAILFSFFTILVFMKLETKKDSTNTFPNLKNYSFLFGIITFALGLVLFMQIFNDKLFFNPNNILDKNTKEVISIVYNAYFNFPIFLQTAVGIILLLIGISVIFSALRRRFR